MAGAGLRADAATWVRAGRVSVNGRDVRDPAHWVDPQRDRVSLDDRPLVAATRTYLLLHQPAGVVTTRHDPEGRPTVYDLIADIDTFVAPVGRLDRDTSGLLILTNDHRFGDHITDPNSHVAKTYLVKVSPRLADEQLRQLRDGIVLSDGPTRPARVARVRDTSRHSYVEIGLTEERNRQGGEWWRRSADGWSRSNACGLAPSRSARCPPGAGGR